MAEFGMSNANDEINQYQMGRYISSNEAVWRILSFSIHERHPTVVHLAVHLENGQRVYFTAQNVRARVTAPPATTLTAFFKLCSDDMFAPTLLYSEVSTYFTIHVECNQKRISTSQARQSCSRTHRSIFNRCVIPITQNVIICVCY